MLNDAVVMMHDFNNVRAQISLCAIFSIEAEY
jgi:hypothetical protein